jgi:hypothetical protein
MRRQLAVLTAIVLSAVLACGGGDAASGERILHFSGRDETEANFRARIQRVMSDNAVAFGLICEQVRDLDAAAALALLRVADGVSAPLPEGATPRPSQTAVPDDLLRSVGIVQEECRRNMPRP